MGKKFIFWQIDNCIRTTSNCVSPCWSPRVKTLLDNLYLKIGKNKMLHFFEGELVPSDLIYKLYNISEERCCSLGHPWTSNDEQQRNQKVNLKWARSGIRDRSGSFKFYPFRIIKGIKVKVMRFLRKLLKTFEFIVNGNVV